MSGHRGQAVFAAVLALLLGGCNSAADWSKEPLPVTVSAANYSSLSDEEVYNRVHAPPATLDAAPAQPAAPTSPLFYAFVPGDVYASDTPLETVFKELATPLAHRGYFNVLYEYRAGYLPKRIDYLIRVHCGVRMWNRPIVRTDKITWGNDGLVASQRNPRSAYLIGERSVIDPRAGISPQELMSVASFFQDKLTPTELTQEYYSSDNLRDGREARDYCLVVLDAFRFDDVRLKGASAPCVWSTFIAVPLHQGQQFSQFLRTMARMATPYFGETTNGIQRYDVPPGKVLMGEPTEVTEPAKLP